MELFWNSLDNALSSIVLYLETKVEVEVCIYDIRSRFTPRWEHCKYVCFSRRADKQNNNVYFIEIHLFFL